MNNNRRGINGNTEHNDVEYMQLWGGNQIAKVFAVSCKMPIKQIKSECSVK